VYKFVLMLIAVGLASIVSADTIESEIVDRIKKVGEVCVEGDDCSAASATVAVTEGAGGGEATYRKSCATCHDIGLAGAPKLADIPAWEPRIAKGIDALYEAAINGLPPGMPAKGMCFTCSDDDLKVAVDYMLDSIK